MNASKILFVGIAFVLFSGTPYAAPADVTAEQYANAERHLAVAADYQAKAQAAKEKAAAHEAMAHHGGSPKGNQNATDNHHKRLAAEYRAEAEKFAAKADEERRLASK